MKTTIFRMIVIAAAVLGLSGIVMPQPGNEKFYVKREKKASPELKLELDRLRQEIKANQYTFQVGYTKAMDYSLESLTGAKEPENFEVEGKLQDALARKLSFIDDSVRLATLKLYPKKAAKINAGFVIPAICPALKSYTVRHTCVRDQKLCGSCWAFGAVGAFEGSWLIRNNKAIDASEQYVLCFSKCGNEDCGDCTGGYKNCAACFLVKSGTPKESAYPYRASSSFPNCQPYRGLSFYRAVAWNYVDGSVVIPSVAKIKAALCQHGPLAVSVRATAAFKAYTGGVFNENSTGATNHSVTLIGWDDTKQAWLIKNSWGTGWGIKEPMCNTRGFMWIAYGSNSIGKYALWVDAWKTFYVLPEYIEKIIP
jgi:cathepsin L